MDMTKIARVAALPFGYTATFRWGPGLAVEWEPGVPRITSRRHHRKFLEAYATERRTFLAEVAAALGGSVAVIDTDGVMEIIGTSNE